MISPNLNKAFVEYYKQIDSSTITREEYKLWIESLEEPMKAHFKAKGLEESRGVLNLLRFTLELRDLPLDEFLRERLTEEEFRAYKEGLFP